MAGRDVAITVESMVSMNRATATMRVTKYRGIWQGYERIPGGDGA
jgi:hypothetical protein